MDKLTFESEIITALGGNLVDVELQQEDLDFAFNRAVRLHKSRGNANERHEFYALSLTADQTVYDIPPEIVTINKIIRLGSGLSADNPFHRMVINDIYSVHNRTGSSLITYDLGLQFLESTEMYLASEIQFSHDVYASKLRLWSKPNTDEPAFLECYRALTEDEYRDVQWIQDWALAELKVILGRAYSKFGTLPGPSGEINLDGRSLIDEGNRDKEVLLQEINDHVDGEPTGLPVMMG